MKKLILTFGLMLAAAVASAETIYPTSPFFSLQRLTVGGRLEHRWRGVEEAAPLSEAAHEWGAGVVGSYELVPRLDLTARSVYFLSTGTTEFALGVNLLLYSGRP